MFEGYLQIFSHYQGSRLFIECHTHNAPLTNTYLEQGNSKRTYERKKQEVSNNMASENDNFNF